MTQQDKEKIEYQLKQINNVAILIKMMTKDVTQYITETNCTQNEAVEKKEKAYDFIKKYAIDYLNNASKIIKETINKTQIIL